jgi:hypothetical protein
MIIEPIYRYFALALELGKTSEGSAVALVELVERLGSPGPAVVPPEKAHYEVRGLRRFTPGTEYGQITDSLRELLDSGPVAEELQQKHVRLPDGGVRPARTQLCWILDQTAVGKPIIDMVLEKFGGPYAYRVIFAGNHTENEVEGLHYIPKHLLISEIEVLLEERRLKIGDQHPLAPDLMKELVNYKERRSAPIASANDPWREQAHDDLVFAVGLACRRLRTVQFQYEFM